MAEPEIKVFRECKICNTILVMVITEIFIMLLACLFTCFLVTAFCFMVWEWDMYYSAILGAIRWGVVIGFVLSIFFFCDTERGYFS